MKEVKLMATKKATTKDVEEVVEAVDETPKGMRPGALADELEISPKVLRAWLRRNYPRLAQEKNTSWYLSDSMVDAAREAYSETDEDDVEVEA
jgi:hypothetical protein